MNEEMKKLGSKWPWPVREISRHLFGGTEQNYKKILGLL
jgi:hypothetical protein